MADKAHEIVVPPIERGTMKLTIRGVSPLLSHKFSDKNKDEMLSKQMKQAKQAKAAKDPEADYKESIYYTRDGKPGFPASGIKKACVEACSFIDGITKVQARGALFIKGDVLPIRGDPTMHEAIVRLNGRTADIRYRAEYPEGWEIDLEVLFNPRVISAESIVNLIENAGMSVGIGDWRPQKSGSFGMFEVKK